MVEVKNKVIENIIKQSYATGKEEKKSKSKKSLPKISLKKLVKKQTPKLPSYSGLKFVQGLAQQQEQLITPQDPLRERYANPEQDNRSLFFRDEYAREKRKRFGGFI